MSVRRKRARKVSCTRDLQKLVEHPLGSRIASELHEGICQLIQHRRVCRIDSLGMVQVVQGFAGSTQVVQHSRRYHPCSDRARVGGHGTGGDVERLLESVATVQVSGIIQVRVQAGLFSQASIDEVCRFVLPELRDSAVARLAKTPA